MNSSVKRGHCSERSELVCVNTVLKRRHRPCRKHHLYSTHLSFFYSVHPSDRPFVQIASSPNIHSGAYGVPNPGLGTGTLSWSWLLQAGRGQNEYTLSTVQGTQAVMREKARGWVEWASRGGLRSREGFWRKHPGGESGGGENKTQEGKTAFAELRGTKQPGLCLLTEQTHVQAPLLWPIVWISLAPLSQLKGTPQSYPPPPQIPALSLGTGWFVVGVSRKCPLRSPAWPASRVLALHADPHAVIPQDEKAEGLINVSNYSLESGQDQKKK